MTPLLNRDLQSFAVDVADATGRLPRTDLAWLSDHLVKVACHLKVEGEVRCRIVADGEMLDLHTKFSNDPTTTDVLTFDLTEGKAAEQAAGGHTPVLDVDLIICKDEAVRQAAARGHEQRRELLLYCLHGILHCIGHDDHDEQAYELMHKREDEVLSAIGVGQIFAAKAGLDSGSTSGLPTPEAGR